MQLHKTPMQLHYFCITNIDIWTNIVINEEKKSLKNTKNA